MREIVTRFNEITCITPKDAEIKADLIIFSDSLLLVTSENKKDKEKKKKMKPIEFFKFFSLMTKSYCDFVKIDSIEENKNFYSIFITSARFKSLKYRIVFEEVLERDNLLNVLNNAKKNFCQNMLFEPEVNNNIFSLRNNQKLHIFISVIHTLKNEKSSTFSLVKKKKKKFF